MHGKILFAALQISSISSVLYRLCFELMKSMSLSTTKSILSSHSVLLFPSFSNSMKTPRQPFSSKKYLSSYLKKHNMYCQTQPVVFNINEIIRKLPVPTEAHLGPTLSRFWWQNYCYANIVRRSHGRFLVKSVCWTGPIAKHLLLNRRRLQIQ